MATDRYLWKELDMARVASNTEIVNVKQTMQDVHRRSYPCWLTDNNVAADATNNTVIAAKRACKVVGVSAIPGFNITANNADYIDVNLWLVRAGVVIGSIVRFTSQTQAFGGGPPWGAGTLSSGIAFDPIAYTAANPTKPMIFESLNNILAGDVLQWQVFKGGAGVVMVPDPKLLFHLTLDLEEI